MSDHFVVVYVRHAQAPAKSTFTITARTLAAGLEKVTEQVEEIGFTTLELARHLDKSSAERMRDSVKSAYETAGYEYVTRKPFN